MEIGLDFTYFRWHISQFRTPTTTQQQREGKKQEPKRKKELITQDLGGRAEITHNHQAKQLNHPTSKMSPVTSCHRSSYSTGVLVEHTTEKDTKNRQKAKKLSVVVVKFSSSSEATLSYYSSVKEASSNLPGHTGCPHTPPPQVYVYVCGFLGWIILSHVVDTSTSGCGEPISPHRVPAPLLILPLLV